MCHMIIIQNKKDLKKQEKTIKFQNQIQINKMNKNKRNLDLKQLFIIISNKQNLL